MPINYPFERDPHPPERGPSLLAVEAHPCFPSLDLVQKWAARRAEAVLGAAAKIENFNLWEKRRIVDFGAGFGGPTIALAQLAQRTGGRVDAVEENAYRVRRMQVTKILPDNSIHLGNGIDFLRALAQADERLDLITAFMLGPDDDGMIAEALLDVAREAAPEGHLLITSDTDTLTAVQRVCQQAEAPYQYIPGDTSFPSSLPGTIVVPLL